MIKQTSQQLDAESKSLEARSKKIEMYGAFASLASVVCASIGHYMGVADPVVTAQAFVILPIGALICFTKYANHLADRAFVTSRAAVYAERSEALMSRLGADKLTS